jgi:hypothetical protein
MEFGDYAQRAVDLMNADLSTLDAVREHSAGRPWLVERVHRSDLAPLRDLQRELGAVVDASAGGDDAGVVELLNALLSRYPVRPRISGHDASSWHLHVSDRGASVPEVIAAESLFGLTLLVTELGADRLGRCSAGSCRRVFLDLTTNRTRQYCSTRCATRTHVAAFRSRKRAANETGESA